MTVIRSYFNKNIFSVLEFKKKFFSGYIVTLFVTGMYIFTSSNNFLVQIMKIMMLLVKNALRLSLPQSSVNVGDKTRVAKQYMYMQTVYMSLDEKLYSERQTTWSIITGRFCKGLPVADDTTLTTLTFYHIKWLEWFFILFSYAKNNRLNRFFTNQFRKRIEFEKIWHHVTALIFF